MNLRKFTVRVGADAPFRALHISDNHICLADTRDDARKLTLAHDRGARFTGGRPEILLQYLDEQLQYAIDAHMPVIHTGDAIDFVSAANLEAVGNALRRADIFMAAGNHEYSLYVGEAWEDEAYKAQSFVQVTSAMPGDIWFQTRTVNGVKFIALDNNYYYVTAELYERFAAALAEGLPTVLAVHNPIYSPDLHRQVMAGKPESEDPGLFGCPEVLLRKLSDHRYRQQKPDDLTLAFVRLCESSPNLKAILSGHLHRFYYAQMLSGVPQYVAGPGYENEAVEYTFI